MPADRITRVAFTEAHGMAHELSCQPPQGVSYSFITPLPSGFRFIRSPIKGYLGHFESSEHDLIEAILSPIRTRNRWIYSVENLQAAAAFSLLGAPLPRAMRLAYLTRLLRRDNLRKIVFWSQAGRNTLATYGHIRDEELLRKVTVVYPAIRQVPDHLIRFDDREVNILFSGDFFRKGGAHVVDAFERAQRQYPSIRLTVCCDERIDFNTSDTALREEYLGRIRRNPAIRFGRVPRTEMVERILPATDIYLLPTYVEAFGFAVLEAMAFGIPVIATNYFAIPEMIDDGVSGYLIDTSMYDCDRLFKGYVVNHIPPDFREYMTEQTYTRLCPLIESAQLRRAMGTAGVRTARTKFSIEQRNVRMREIYDEALQ